MATKTLVQIRLNGEETAFLCEPRQSLLEVLRENLGLTGAKEGCNNGNCGACNVILDGVLVNSCLVLAVEVEGMDMLTIEGIGRSNGLHPLQAEFLEHAALQCGICTPGFIVSSYALLQQNPHPTEAEVRRWLAGNLCRCTGYDKIVRAVLAVASKTEVETGAQAPARQEG
jgi:carbon-monoxide dehydrogenase small subunit